MVHRSSVRALPYSRLDVVSKDSPIGDTKEGTGLRPRFFVPKINVTEVLLDKY